MPVTRFSSPFAPLSLSLDEKEQLCHVADTIVSETMVLYERFLGQDKGCLDPATWEKMREREQTRVYLNRQPGGGTGNPDMHLLLTIGTVVGTLHDAMYGALVTSTDTMRIKSAYLNDTLIDMCVLDTIVQPAPDDPFESMVVRWSVHGVPLHVRLLVKHNDAVFIEMTAMRQLSNGERVGVHLTHTVAFDKTPVLKQYSRTNASNCAIWRQTASDRVEMFLTSYFEVKDSMMAGLVVKALSEVMLAKGKIIECARLKKLSWLVQNKNALAKCEANSGQAPDEGCSVCGSQHRSARRGIKSACAVCSKYTCDKCRVKQTLHMIAPDGQLLKHGMRFCVPCIRSATILDGAAVAADEASRGLRSMDYGSLDYNTMSHTISSSSVSSRSGDDTLYNVRRADSDYSISSRR